MSTAGYSGTPLLKKLGIKEEMKVHLINPPENYFDLIEKNISNQLINKNEVPDFVHLFTQSRKEFEKEMKRIAMFCKKNLRIIIWVSWL
jgi:glutathione synthase/RimK-type ligase-like ATP-grasp enzyme